MPDSELYDLVIIGGGPGGLSAGIYAMRAALKTVLIEMGAPGGQINNSDSVENWPGDEHIGGAELAMKFSLHAQSYGLEIRSDEVAELEPGLEFHTVKLANGEKLRSHAVILATGGSPRKINIPGEEEFYGKGVSYCAVCDGFFFRDKNVVVVGGGDTAAEESLYLAKLAKQVYIIHRRDALRAGALLQQRVKAECKIEILWNSVVTAIQAIRQLDLKKIPAISETIDWARSLLLLHADKLDEELVRSTLNVLLKFEDDIEATDSELRQMVRDSGID